AKIIAQRHKLPFTLLRESLLNEFKSAVLVFWSRFEPFDIFLLSEVDKFKIFFDGAASGKQGCRTTADCDVELTYGDLVQIMVVKPNFFTITDNGLLIRCFINPSEFVRAFKLHYAAGSL